MKTQISFVILMFLFLIQACSTIHPLEGFYRNYKLVSGGSSISDLVFRADSTISIRSYDDQGDYSTYEEICGTWRINDGIIQVNALDTVPYLVEYIPDTSNKLKLQLFDSYDCPILVEVWALNTLDGGFLFEVNFGNYQGSIPPSYKNIDLLFMSWGFTKKIEIKRDSMQINVHGLKLNQPRLSKQLNEKNWTLTYTQKGRNVVSYCKACSGVYRKTVFYKKDFFEFLPDE